MSVNEAINTTVTIKTATIPKKSMVADPASGSSGAVASTGIVQTIQSQSWSDLWKSLRSILLIWALAVWALLVLMPGVEQIHNMKSAMLHLPYIFIGLGLVGAMFAAYSLRSDGHLLWFLGVLLLLAGWM